MNKNLMRVVGFGKEVDDIEKGLCPLCNQEVDTNSFCDEISRREFKTSGLCQKCQDEIFAS